MARDKKKHPFVGVEKIFGGFIPLVQREDGPFSLFVAIPDFNVTFVKEDLLQDLRHIDCGECGREILP